MSTFSPLDLIESDMWRWNVLSVSISIPFILMFLTYNYCAKWPLRIVRTVQNLCQKTCAKRLLCEMSCIPPTWWHVWKKIKMKYGMQKFDKLIMIKNYWKDISLLSVYTEKGINCGLGNQVHELWTLSVTKVLLIFC